MDDAILEHFKSGSKVCMKCGVNPVQGCRCVMGATHCSDCYKHKPVDMEKINKDMAESLMHKIDDEILAKYNARV